MEIDQPANYVKSGCDQRDEETHFEGFPETDDSAIVFITEVFNTNKDQGKRKDHTGIAIDHPVFEIAGSAKDGGRDHTHSANNQPGDTSANKNNFFHLIKFWFDE